MNKEERKKDSKNARKVIDGFFAEIDEEMGEDFNPRREYFKSIMRNIYLLMYRFNKYVDDYELWIDEEGVEYISEVCDDIKNLLKTNYERTKFFEEQGLLARRERVDDK